MRFKRHVHIAFTGHFRAVSDARLNILALQTGIVLENFPLGRARSQQVEDERNPDAMTTDARLAKTARGINPDSLEQFFPGKALLRLGFHGRTILFGVLVGKRPLRLHAAQIAWICSDGFIRLTTFGATLIYEYLRTQRTGMWV